MEGLASTTTTAVVPEHDNVTDAFIPAPKFLVFRDTEIEEQVKADEDSIIIDDDKWLADARTAVVEDGLCSSHLQEIPDDEVVKYFDGLASEEEEGLFDGDKHENGSSEENNSSPVFSSKDEVSPIEENFSLDITDAADVNSVRDPEADAEKAAEIHKIVWESKKSSEQNRNTDLMKHPSHKRDHQTQSSVRSPSPRRINGQNCLHQPPMMNRKEPRRQLSTSKRLNSWMRTRKFLYQLRQPLRI